MPTQITNYQNVLKYARSKVDYAYGLGLYMSPSDMVLQIGTIVGYNNKIVIATENQTLGFNNDVNVKPVAQTLSEPVKPEPEQKYENDTHEDNKTAIIVGSIVVGIGVLIIYERTKRWDFP